MSQSNSHLKNAVQRLMKKKIAVLCILILIIIYVSGLLASIIAPYDYTAQDYIRTAKAKGLSFYTVSNRHVLRNAMIPIVTILSFSLAGILGGAFITETILGIPGVGRFSVESIFNRDYPVIMAITLISAIAFIFANLLADISYSIIDPRIRYK